MLPVHSCPTIDQPPRSLGAGPGMKWVLNSSYILHYPSKSHLVQSNSPDSEFLGDCPDRLLGHDAVVVVLDDASSTGPSPKRVSFPAGNEKEQEESTAPYRAERGLLYGLRRISGFKRSDGPAMRAAGQSTAELSSRYSGSSLVFFAGVFAGVFPAVPLSFLQPGRPSRARVTTIADTHTITFRLRVVICFPFLSEFSCLAYVRGTPLLFSRHRPSGGSRTPDIYPFRRVLSSPVTALRVRSDTELAPAQACLVPFSRVLFLPDKIVTLRIPALGSGTQRR